MAAASRPGQGEWPPPVVVGAGAASDLGCGRVTGVGAWVVAVFADECRVISSPLEVAWSSRTPV